jgi:hypothetical protein
MAIIGKNIQNFRLLCRRPSGKIPAILWFRSLAIRTVFWFGLTAKLSKQKGGQADSAGIRHFFGQLDIQHGGKDFFGSASAEKSGFVDGRTHFFKKISKK